MPPTTEKQGYGNQSFQKIAAVLLPALHSLELHGTIRETVRLQQSDLEFAIAATGYVIALVLVGYCSYLRSKNTDLRRELDEAQKNPLNKTNNNDNQAAKKPTNKVSQEPVAKPTSPQPSKSRRGKELTPAQLQTKETGGRMRVITTWLKNNYPELQNVNPSVDELANITQDLRKFLEEEKPKVYAALQEKGSLDNLSQIILTLTEYHQAQQKTNGVRSEIDALTKSLHDRSGISLYREVIKKGYNKTGALTEKSIQALLDDNDLLSTHDWVEEYLLTKLKIIELKKTLSTDIANQKTLKDALKALGL
ncbi:hypothetical protein IPJ91_00545 [bacterium]|nr:MAG: hypothetical protein IPJ91_00545 [bacterium]